MCLICVTNHEYRLYRRTPKSYILPGGFIVREGVIATPINETPRNE